MDSHHPGPCFQIFPHYAEGAGFAALNNTWASNHSGKAAQVLDQHNIGPVTA